MITFDVYCSTQTQGTKELAFKQQQNLLYSVSVFKRYFLTCWRISVKSVCPFGSSSWFFFSTLFAISLCIIPGSILAMFFSMFTVPFSSTVFLFSILIVIPINFLTLLADCVKSGVSGAFTVSCITSLVSALIYQKKSKRTNHKIEATKWNVQNKSRTHVTWFA